MANLPVNPSGIVSTTSVTGSYAGFTVVSGSATFTGVKDANGVDIAGSGLTFTSGATVPIYVTSASISAGAILLYN